MKIVLRMPYHDGSDDHAGAAQPPQIAAKPVLPPLPANRDDPPGRLTCRWARDQQAAALACRWVLAA